LENCLLAPAPRASGIARDSRLLSENALPQSFRVSRKSEKIAALIGDCGGGAHDAHYAGYFACFNRGQFYEAHDVLEELWLPIRREPSGDFYKGLIQLAGAFVHLQKNRLRPADALFRLAENNLTRFAPAHASLDLQIVLALIRHWRSRLAADDFAKNPLASEPAPRLAFPIV
jgi:hypothetical protein